MALATYNATLEYAANTLELWLYDDAGGAISFDPATSFNIERIDDETKVYSVVGTVAGNKITFALNPTEVLLASAGDNLYSYDEPEFYHIYSVRSASQVYLSGKLNLVKAA